MIMDVATEYPELMAVLEKIVKKEFGEKPKSLQT
jgi:hypothetical protein